MASSIGSAIAHLKDMGRANRNVRLLFLGSSLSGVASGIFAVIFNLYILGMGISPEVLGGILSAGPFAEAIGSIPMGFLMERIGFKKVFIIIYGVSALSRLLQVATTDPSSYSITTLLCANFSRSMPQYLQEAYFWISPWTWAKTA